MNDDAEKVSVTDVGSLVKKVVFFDQFFEGEYLLTAAGEMHLELCLRDLRERYAKIDIEASLPVVPFRGFR